MELSELARKQKRVKDWSEFLFNDGISEDLRISLGTSLELYKKTIARCWEQKRISPEDIRQMARLERELEEINERIRLAVPATLSREFEK